MPSQISRDSTASEESTKLFVKNFDPQPTKDQFDALFKQYGLVVWSAIKEDQPGKPFGLVHYLDAASATAAIAALHNKKGEWSRTGRIQVLRGRTREDQRLRAVLREGTPQAPPLRMEPGVGKQISTVTDAAATQKESFTTIRVKNFSCSTKAGLRELCQPFGAIRSVSFVVDPSDPGRKWGFVDFRKHSSAFNAIASLHGSDPESSGSPLYVAHERTWDERESSRRKIAEVPTCIWFDVDAKLTDQNVFKLMKGFGHVVQCRSKVNNHGECSGYVCFGTAEVAQAAMDGLRKSPSKFRVKFWDPSSANVLLFDRQAQADVQQRRKAKPQLGPMSMDFDDGDNGSPYAFLASSKGSRKQK